MKISGFSFMRNTDKLYYPLRESIQSILPIVDEMIIALGEGDEDDATLELVRGLNSEKIKIIPTQWDLETYQGGTIYAQQTDIAKSYCKGDWLIYLQSDEVIHEKYLVIIQEFCGLYLNVHEVEGFLFRYKHFYGDYQHYIQSHVWYPREIRVIRNHPSIHSWGDAQSFRWIDDFDGLHYRQHVGARPLRVVEIPAEIYHYGWVRPPALMQTKTRVMNKAYHDPDQVDREYDNKPQDFDYGALSRLTEFTETHPSVMREFISKFNWKEQLHYERNYRPQRPALKHEKIKYRLLSWIENNLLGGSLIFGYRNWTLIRQKKK
ncbi:MAG: hypothetical protein K1X68_03065 [Saprospiraceae bacterium]|nr:hypothetical protein [Saprospiraceae bacterium]HMW37873.1 hypothetical protein [Saprospiraceae bacterium]HMX87383.1 hypothetical protein [Saprospiraceae bacterium]HMZ39210.1 hypothetical protein [Saprospiraceae bacterium]HNA63491.1 hypothetical protein [Saprospiraceae bacterium]